MRKIESLGKLESLATWQKKFNQLICLVKQVMWSCWRKSKEK
ncbi:MAG: hypothetical protein H6Q70_3837 [Firmicutes bacterium]|nr:hypothetical protein [Bacillota bacterium]